jgi:NADH dehydrogenase
MDRVLAGFPDELAEAARRRLMDRHVEVRFEAAVASYDGKMVTLKNSEVIPACTLIWAAGVRAVRLLDQTGLKQARQGRVIVEPTLQVPGRPEVFVIGDAAYLEDDGKQPLPMMAPVAIQQGKTAARNIRSLLAGRPLAAFDYRDPGSLATIGRNAAVARVKGLKFEGFIAWLVWLAVHLFWLIGFRNRLLVMINWAWDYFLFERGVRVIEPDGNPHTEDTPWAGRPGLAGLSGTAHRQRGECSGVRERRSGPVIPHHRRRADAVRPYHTHFRTDLLILH